MTTTKTHPALAALGSTLGFSAPVADAGRTRPQVYAFSLLNVLPGAYTALERVLELADGNEELVEAITKLVEELHPRVTFDKTDHATQGQPLRSIDGGQAAVWVGGVMVTQIRAFVSRAGRRGSTASIVNGITAAAQAGFNADQRANPPAPWRPRLQAGTPAPVDMPPATMGGGDGQDDDSGPRGW